MILTLIIGAVIGAGCFWLGYYLGSKKTETVYVAFGPEDSSKKPIEPESHTDYCDSMGAMD